MTAIDPRQDAGSSEPRPEVFEDLVDAYFDRSLDAERRARLLTHLRENVREAERLAGLDQGLRMLREIPEGAIPDQRREILRRVGMTRGFVGSTMRRLVGVGRAAAVLALAAGLLGIAMAQRWAPERLTLVERPMPVTEVVRVSQVEAGLGLEDLARSFESRTREFTTSLDEALRSVTVVLHTKPGSDRLPVLATLTREGDLSVSGSSPAVRVIGREAFASLVTSKSMPVVIPLGFVSGSRPSGTPGGSGVDWSSACASKNPLVLPSRVPDLCWDPSGSTPGGPQVVLRRGW